jgi:predicted dehydrogenase
MPQLTRRHFLASMTLAGGVATLTGRAWAQQADRKIRMGVVGGNFGASWHWHEHPNCVVEAVSDLIPGRLANLQQRYQCQKTHDCLETLIRDDRIDAVAVFTGAPDHVRHCTAVMNAGKHVISAVPAALTLEGCEQLIEAKERNGVRYMMAETSWYRWPTITARNLHALGQFGEMKYSEGEYYHPLIGTESDNLLRVPGGREKSWRFGLPPMLYPTHSSGFLTGVTGERVVRVSSLGSRGARGGDIGFQENAYNNPFDSQASLMETDQGHIFRCNVMWGVWAHGERAQWFGTKLALFMDGWAGQPYFVNASDGSQVAINQDYWPGVPEAMRYDSGHGASHPFLTNEFIQAILEDREPVVSVYEAVALTAPGIVAYDSALRGGEQLKVPSFDPRK